MPDSRSTLIEELATSQQRIVTFMLPYASGKAPEPRTGGWSLRDVAAHLEACERECFEPRVRSMAGGEQPRFDFYSNSERDFGEVDLAAVLADWIEMRSALLDFVKSLDGEELGRVGRHAEFGEITVEAYLRIALEHDLEHWRALEEAMSGGVP